MLMICVVTEPEGGLLVPEYSHAATASHSVCLTLGILVDENLCVCTKLVSDKVLVVPCHCTLGRPPAYGFFLPWEGGQSQFSHHASALTGSMRLLFRVREREHAAVICLPPSPATAQGY